MIERIESDIARRVRLADGARSRQTPYGRQGIKKIESADRMTINQIAAKTRGFFSHLFNKQGK